MASKVAWGLLQEGSTGALLGKEWKNYLREQVPPESSMEEQICR